MIRISYRFTSDPIERPNQTEDLPASSLVETVAEINAAGGVVIDSRPLHWSESLAVMENAATV